jgi:site-specific DNA-methyltransferase (adenine-specific)
MIKLIRGDCLAVLKRLPAGSVDAVVTDPPYGVSFIGKRTKWAASKANVGYRNLTDGPEVVREIAAPAIRECIEKFGRVALFPGVRNAWEYPGPDDIGGVFMPNGAGMGRWGFNCFHPVLFYGKRPHRGPTPNSIKMTCPTEKIDGHPCPKPLAWMTWLIKKATLPGDTVLDPFMGSGTTGVACVLTGRSFIGIEIDPEYHAIARRRIRAAQKAPVTA